MYTKEQIAQTIDHAVLKPFATDKDIIENCSMVDQRRVKSICVRPTDVKLAAEKLKDSDVIVSMVVGFPHGSNRTETKVLETKLGAEDGAVEFDMVMNIGKFLSGDYEFVQNDIAAVVGEARKHKTIVKVILETCYLSSEQIEKACKKGEGFSAFSFSSSSESIRESICSLFRFFLKLCKYIFILLFWLPVLSRLWLPALLLFFRQTC